MKCRRCGSELKVKKLLNGKGLLSVKEYVCPKCDVKVV